MAFVLEKLPYAFNALEPHIDARTMEIHHEKHHAAYTANLNKAIEGTDLEGKKIEDLFKEISALPTAVRNNGGGFYNHNLYWSVMGPNGGGTPSGDILNGINRDFGSFDKFKEIFSNAAATRFGSGWAWLCLTNEDKFSVCSTPNQDNPLMDVVECKAKKILLTIDVWEHAYYLKYQNRRPDYITAFWNVINWDAVAAKLK